jgi:cytochrome oxidase Cu insertion factor (SCO1/SenC/PrrC family)
MKFGKKLFVLFVILTILAACGGGTSPNPTNKPDDTNMENPTEEAMTLHETTMPETMPASSDATAEGAMTESPSWFSASLTNVNTGETFTINDLKGRVILVETMAVWCINCYHQQTQVKALHASLGERDDFVSLGMDIDPNEDTSKLKSFVETNGFGWMYVVSPPDVSRELATLYGGQFLNPPSTPMLIIDRHGVAHPLPFGIKSADDLQQALQPFLDETI